MSPAHTSSGPPNAMVASIHIDPPELGDERRYQQQSTKPEQNQQPAPLRGVAREDEVDRGKDDEEQADFAQGFLAAMPERSPRLGPSHGAMIGRVAAKRVTISTASVTAPSRAPDPSLSHSHELDLPLSSLSRLTLALPLGYDGLRRWPDTRIRLDVLAEVLRDVE